MISTHHLGPDGGAATQRNAYPRTLVQIQVRPPTPQCRPCYDAPRKKESLQW